jgi:hypothetical protein
MQGRLFQALRPYRAMRHISLGNLLMAQLLIPRWPYCQGFGMVVEDEVFGIIFVIKHIFRNN